MRAILSDEGGEDGCSICTGGSVATRLNTPVFRQLVESRDAQFGARAGVRWAEGFVVREPILRAGLLRAAGAKGHGG